MRAVLQQIGALVLAFVGWLGGTTAMLMRVVVIGPRRPFGVDDIIHQILMLGVRSLPISAFLSLFIGMILAQQFGDALQDFGMTMALGETSSVALVNELVPTLLALTVGSKMAAGMTAELGSMKVTEQIDAVAALGADPIKKLVWPRVVASTLTLPLLVVCGNVLSLAGGMLIGELIFGVPATYFYETFVDYLEPIDYLQSMIKGTVFGTLVGIIGCFNGFNTGYGTESVGLATTQTVVASSLCIIVADFYIGMLFIGS